MPDCKADWLRSKKNSRRENREFHAEFKETKSKNN